MDNLPLIIVVVLLVLLVVFVIGIYNGLVQRRLRIDEAFAQIEVQLKRRHDLIPNLVNAVKGYMGFEQKVLTDVTNARAAAVSAGAQGPAQQAAAENALTGTLRSLFAVVENYPELKANQNVLELQEHLAANIYVLPLAFADETTVVHDVVAGPVVRLVSDPSERFWEVLTWRLADDR